MTSRIMIITTKGPVLTDPMNEIDAEATWHSISSAVARCIGVVVHVDKKRHVIAGRHIVEWHSDEVADETDGEDHPHSPRDADGNTHPDAYWAASDG